MQRISTEGGLCGFAQSVFVGGPLLEQKDRLMPTMLFILASISGFLAVAFGAFGAHALKARLEPGMLVVFETAVRYQFYHTFALFVSGWALQKFQHGPFGTAGGFFIAGIVIFSGSLYALSLTGIRQFGAVTPVGGLAFLVGWVLLLIGFWKQR
jgi:uncharacterized membrane protein YgdD (TMEM256/DUF423 family)